MNANLAISPPAYPSPQERRQTPPPITGHRCEIPLLDRELKRIAATMDKDAGIHISMQKTSLVHSRLIKRLRTLGMDDFSQYCDLVESIDGKDERKTMLMALTTNLTRFFREPHHFEHLLKTSLPPLIEAAKRGERIRLWSAGCSNGQEPYSIAALVLSLCPNANQYDIKILASDIDTKMIEHGARGIYDEDLMEKMPANLRKQHFQRKKTADGMIYRASQQMRNLVTFRELNLNAPSWPMKGKFQIIFCRNVVIYFNQETQDILWNRFYQHLGGMGHLYIGHSERLNAKIADKFQSTGTTSFKLAK